MKKGFSIAGLRKLLIIAGLALHIVYFVYGILSLGDYEYSGTGVGRAFAYWISAMVVSIPCLLIYSVEAIVAMAMNRRTFHLIKAILIGFALPLCFLVGGSPAVVNSIVWNTYFAGIFVLQVVSLFIKDRTSQ